MNSNFADPQLKRILEKLASGDVLIDDSEDVDDVLPGFSRAQELGLAKVSSSGGWGVYTRFALTDQGRRKMGMPTTRSLWQRARALFGR